MLLFLILKIIYNDLTGLFLNRVTCGGSFILHASRADSLSPNYSHRQRTSVQLQDYLSSLVESVMQSTSLGRDRSSWIGSVPPFSHHGEPIGPI